MWQLKLELDKQLELWRRLWTTAAENKAAGNVAADADEDALKANAALNKAMVGAGAAKPPDSFKPFGLAEDAHTMLLQAMETAADELFEDSKGDQSIIVQLQKFSNRFDVMKIPYMLSNTAVYKRMFIWPVSANIGKTPWDFYKMCSMGRMRIVQSSNQAAAWHIAVAKHLLTQPQPEAGSQTAQDELLPKSTRANGKTATRNDDEGESETARCCDCILL